MSKYFVSPSASLHPALGNILESTTVWRPNPSVGTWYTPDSPGLPVYTIMGPPDCGLLTGTLAGSLITAITVCRALSSVYVAFQFRGTEGRAQRKDEKQSVY
jgi:hypothetical protein